MINEKKCTKCLKIKFFTDFGLNKTGKFGLRSQCKSCVKLSNIRYHRSIGIKHIDDITEKTNLKGRYSERIAKKFFEKYGYLVLLNNGRGPDLVCSKRNLKFFVEVKTVIKSNKYNSYYVGRVWHTRVKDDYICFVLNNTVIWVQSMESHLKFYKNKQRVITNIIHNQKQSLTHLASKL